MDRDSVACCNTLLPIIPRNSFFELDAAATEDVKRTADGQVDLATAQLLHQFQVLQIASTACIRDWNGTDGRQELYKLGVDAGLFAFDVRGVDQKLCAVRLEECDVFFEECQ